MGEAAPHSPAGSGPGSQSAARAGAVTGPSRRTPRQIVTGLLIGAFWISSTLALNQYFLRQMSLALQGALSCLLVLSGLWGLVALYVRATGRGDEGLRKWYHRAQPLLPAHSEVEGVTLDAGAFVYPLLAFSSVTALLLRHNTLLTAAGVPRDGGGLIYITVEAYAWNLVNAVPVLDLTEVFGWHPALTLTNEWGRVFILVFKIVMIVPLLHLADQLVERRLWRPSDTPGPGSPLTALAGAAIAEAASAGGDGKTEHPA